jgi:protein tyrosine phosphatase (PTP) superfamily phosphohydrolase (DUF442 family)
MRLLPVAVGLLVSCVTACSNSAAGSERYNFARKAHIPGVKDAGKVDDFLYRGAQPSEEGLKELRKLGVDTIIDLRGEWPWEVKKERNYAQSLGMRFVNLPGNGWSPPSDRLVAKFFTIVQERPKRRIFVHCWLGGDRSGVFIAVYRIAFDGWTPEAAIQEMRAYHFKAFLHPTVTAYVRSFPERLARSPSLAAFRHVRSHQEATPIR